MPLIVFVDTASTRSLGVSLTAEDCAKEIVSLAQNKSRLPLPHGVHYPVGRQAKALFAMTGVSPGWMVREINRRVAARH